MCNILRRAVQCVRIVGIEPQFFRQIAHAELLITILFALQPTSQLVHIAPNMLIFSKIFIKLFYQAGDQRYTYRVLQTIQIKLILLCVWAEHAILGSAKTALRFKYEI